MATVDIRGVPVRFPFQPYEIQKDYMCKVIECLQTQQNGLLESPTGTGKTLSLLCSSLAWLELKKAQVQAQRLAHFDDNNFQKKINEELGSAAGYSQNRRCIIGMPTIIYASRTHSQLSQAMQELKKTEYKYMKAIILGSREQMCIHEEVLREQSNSNKVQMCRMKVKTRSCHFYNKIDKKKDDPVISNLSIIDMEDIVKLGKCHKFCPYYMSKELKNSADIVFMPYNYLLDPSARRALGIELGNNIVILDEAHNIEKVCEESASFQMKSTDITMCIEEITAVMKNFKDDASDNFLDDSIPKDFTEEELCVLKQIFLDFEKMLDEIELKGNAPEGTYFEGNYIFELLSKAGITDGNAMAVTSSLDKIIQFLTVTASNNDGIFQKRGNGLQLFSDFLCVVFASLSSEYKEKIKKCYKVHVSEEESHKKISDNWLSKLTKKSRCRVLSYWCFSPGFGMNKLMENGVHCVILTSGTLAPLAPLMSELELNVGVNIENPHIVKGDQVCVKVLSKGPDNELLICNYTNRDNPKYLHSLGRTIVNLIRVIPNGVLIFFPSYPIMLKCQKVWQESGIWSEIDKQKATYVEPKDKESFNNAMNSYYQKVNDPQFKGAIFMGVCRGKVSEGLDFADINGRAVFIIGLPYPPLKDPRVILKKRYLDSCNAKNKQYLRGDDWYSLEATRAINQAIGRVIRHKHDYGAIVLLDSRFTNLKIRGNLSKWLQQHITIVQNFGEIIRPLRVFFQNAEANQPAPKVKEENTESLKAEFDVSAVYKTNNFDFSTSSTANINGLVNIHKRKPDLLENNTKKMKITVVSNPSTVTPLETSTREYITMVKKALDAPSFKQFLNALSLYRDQKDFNQLLKALDNIFLTRYKDRYILKGLEIYIKDPLDKVAFEEYCQKMQ